jgi:hypothetical protein
VPLSRLLCEGVAGGPDAVILAAIFAPDGPEVVPAISKTNLGAGVRALRRVGRMNVAAIRDRDFDFVPEHGDDPVVLTWDSEPVGWRWRRHELESYLVDPALVVPATIEIAGGSDVSGYEQILLTAARTVAPYQAARWALGDIRRRLPPRLRGRPERFNKDFELLPDLSVGACMSWAREEMDAHRTTIPETVALEALYQTFLDRFTAETFDAHEALLWFSGKDLMAAVARQAQEASVAWWSSAGSLRNMVRDWIRDHAEEAVRRVPEWGRLKDLVNG